MIKIRIKKNTWAEVSYLEDGNCENKNILFESGDDLNCECFEKVYSNFNKNNVMVDTYRIVLRKDNNPMIAEDSWEFKMEDICFDVIDD